MAAHLTVGLGVRVMDNTDPDFYPLMGPFLARRHVARDLGGRLWDDDGKRWFVAISDGAVVGFCAALPGRRRVAYQSAYVLPSHRRQGIYRHLFTIRDTLYEGTPASAVCTPASLPLLLAHHFTTVRARGSYTEVRRD